MGIFNKKITGPYKEDSTNLIYELLFGDHLELYINDNAQKELFPWNVLFDKKLNIPELQKIIMDDTTESRVKILAYNKLRDNGEPVETKDFHGVIVEVSLEEGLDTLACYRDGTARYINHSGKIIIWETNDTTSAEISSQLFRDSSNIVNRIGPWNKPRLPYPKKGNVRISFLVSDGLYFGEGPLDTLFSDPMAGPALSSATAMVQYLTNMALQKPD